MSKQLTLMRDVICYGVNDHKERILFKYSTKSDAYGMFEDYRVNSFEDLARA